VVGICDSVYRYQPDAARDDAVIAGLQQAVEKYPAYGFSKLFKILRRWGHRWNHKRVHRIYCRLNLNKRRRGKKRLPNRYPIQRTVPDTINRCWSIDFMCDSLFCGRRFRTLNIVDDFSREVLAIEIDVGLSAERVILFCFFNVLILDFPRRIFPWGCLMWIHYPDRVEESEDSLPG